jgi:hypothetical protein
VRLRRSGILASRQTPNLEVRDSFPSGATLHPNPGTFVDRLLSRFNSPRRRFPRRSNVDFVSFGNHLVDEQPGMGFTPQIPAEESFTEV